jgi:hypothetical protein
MKVDEKLHEGGKATLEEPRLPGKRGHLPSRYDTEASEARLSKHLYSTKRHRDNCLMPRLLLVCLFLAAFSLRSHAEDDAQARALFDKLLAAQDSHDYDAFVADATDGLKAALTKTQFDASSNILTARAKDGRAITFLGELNERGYEIYLYRLRFKDGDMLGTLSLQDGKVAGILFR